MNNLVSLIGLNLYLTGFLAYCLLLGTPVTYRLCAWGDEKEIGLRHLRLFFSVTVGLCLAMLALFALGIVGLFRPTTIFTVLLLLLMASLASLFTPDQSTPSRSILRSAFSFVAKSHSRLPYLDLSIVLLLLLILNAQAVAVPGRWDDTLYHLPMARSYIEHSGITTNEFLRYPLFPQNMELLFSLGLMIDAEIAAQGMATLPFLISSIGLIGASEKFIGSRIPGYLSIIALFYTPFISSTLGYAYIDNGLALLCWGATLAVAIWENLGRRHRGWLVLAGVLAGSAAGTKLFGGILAAILGLLVLGRCRSWKEPAVYAASALAFGAWWYLRSAIISGDPVHPLGGGVFGYYLWNADDLLFQHQEQATHGVSKNIIYIFQSLVAAGVPWWLLAFPSIAYARQSPAGFSTFYFVFIIYILFWLFATQVERYLSPICIVASFLVISFIYHLARSCLARMSSGGSAMAMHPAYPAVLLLLALIPMTVHSYSRALSKLTNWEQALLGRPGYEIFQQANMRRATYGDRILQIGFELGIYFFHGTVIGDQFGPGRYRQMTTCSPDGSCRMDDAERIIEIMRSFDCRMLAVDGSKIHVDTEAFAGYFDILRFNGENYLLLLK